jgi:hypothetical protein
MPSALQCSFFLPSIYGLAAGGSSRSPSLAGSRFGRIQLFPKPGSHDSGTWRTAPGVRQPGVMHAAVKKQTHGCREPFLINCLAALCSAKAAGNQPAPGLPFHGADNGAAMRAPMSSDGGQQREQATGQGPRQVRGRVNIRQVKLFMPKFRRASFSPVFSYLQHAKVP